MTRRAPALSNFDLEKLSYLLENARIDLDPAIDPTTAQGDDRIVERLREELQAQVPFRPDLFWLIEAITAAISDTWPQDIRPTLAIVLGERHRGYDGASSCGAMSGHEVVSDKLGDPDDLFWEYIWESDSSDGANIYLLHNPTLEHSLIRWIDPSGDRTIVTLPAAYDLR